MERDCIPCFYKIEAIEKILTSDGFLMKVSLVYLIIILEIDPSACFAIYIPDLVGFSTFIPSRV